MNFSEAQQIVVQTKEKKVVVASCAGSGKTRCLAGRLEWLLNNNYDPSKIVAITFTNLAAQEIKERINVPQGLFVGTIHSYANQLLMAAGVDTRDYLEKEQFDLLFKLVKENPHCIKEVKYLLLDEGQDSTPHQFEFMLDLVHPEEWMFFADWRQSIYRWNGAYPDYIFSLMAQPGVITYELGSNYRNGQTILEFAQALIRGAGKEYLDKSEAVTDEEGRVQVVKYSPEHLANGIKQIGDYKNWFVLCRTNAQINEICKLLEKNNIPFVSFKKLGMSNEELKEKMESDQVKVLTIHTAKGLEAKYVAVIGAKTFSIEEVCISYVAATRARDLLVWAQDSAKKRKLREVESWEM